MSPLNKIVTVDDYNKYLLEFSNSKNESFSDIIRTIAFAEAMVVFRVLHRKILELEQKIQRLERRS